MTRPEKKLKPSITTKYWGEYLIIKASYRRPEAVSGLIRLYRGIVIQNQIYVNSGLHSLKFITFFKFVLKLTEN
jgi:hypothetical protein